MGDEKSQKSLNGMKLLILDMDGVVNRGADNCSPDRHIYDDRFSHVVPMQNGKGTCELTYVDPELAKRVSKLISDYDLYIVSSSTWRLYYSQEEFKELLTLRGLPGERLVGYTPNLYRDSSFFGGGCPRRTEIRAFMEHAEEEFGWDIEFYVILDDDPSANYDTEKGRLFLTDFDKGYDAEIDKEVRKYLDEK